MKGKLVNAIVGLMNLLYGALVLFFNFYMPNINNATEQEVGLIKQNYTLIFGLLIVVAIVNLVTLIFNYKDKIFLFSYVLAILSSSFYFLDFNYIAVLYILAALLVEIQVLRENLIFINNVFYMVIVSVVIVAIGLVGINIFTYKDELKKIMKEENKGYVEYNEDYFKNISELGEDAEFYINVQRNGKWGYINSNGDIKIDFEYDYASPFVTIRKYDKNFDVALVVQGETAKVILKNKRNVMSYKNEISVTDYEGQLEKLNEIYQETLKQDGEVEEGLKTTSTSNMNSIKAYDGYPYRYPFNDEYDVYITVSQSGGKNRYEFLRRDNPKVKISIDCDNLKFDENNLYVFSNGCLPFYKTSEKIQGWYTKETKRIELNGNIQILEFFDSQILIKDYDRDVIYFANENGEQVSPTYKDIYVLDNAYIVKQENDKYIVVDKQFQKILDIEYDYIDVSLLNTGLLICANLPLKVNFNETGYPSNIEMDLVDLSGNKITLKNRDGTVIDNPAYTAVYSVSNKKHTSNYDLYISELTDIPYDFIGEEFYE